MEYLLSDADHGTWLRAHLRPLAVGIFGLLLLALFSPACSKDKSKKPSPPVPVTVDTAVQRTVPVQLRAIGNVEAHSTVTVKSKVGGELVRVHFIEGQDVNKGSLLFTIDPRPYEAALKQAEANLQKDIAQAKHAREDAQRYKFLIQKGVVPQQQYDKFSSDADALEATVLADRAAVDNAKIQLGYCSIYSPIDGRTGSLIVKQGNIIKAEDINLVVINQIIPIDVTFSVPEQFLPEIKRYMASRNLQVETFIPMDEGRPERGMITFIDNAVDTNTGTIRLKGTFANTGRRLWPGQFVNVILTLTTQPNAILIPSQAVQTGQEGQYIFVIKPDFTAEQRPVVVGRTLNNETIIEKGLQAGEKVVTDGQLQLVPGTKVEVKTRPASPEPGP